METENFLTNLTDLTPVIKEFMDTINGNLKDCRLDSSPQLLLDDDLDFRLKEWPIAMSKIGAEFLGLELPDKRWSSEINVFFKQLLEEKHNIKIFESVRPYYNVKIVYRITKTPCWFAEVSELLPPEKEKNHPVLLSVNFETYEKILGFARIPDKGLIWFSNPSEDQGKTKMFQPIKIPYLAHSIRGGRLSFKTKFGFPIPFENTTLNLCAREVHFNIDPHIEYGKFHNLTPQIDLGSKKYTY